MSLLLERVIAADPVLQRVFFDERRLAPTAGETATVNLILAAITERKVDLFKARDLPEAERLVFGWRRLNGQRVPGIRELYFRARRHCDGHFADYLANLVDDDCEHVVAFEHGNGASVFKRDHRAWAALRHRHNARPPVSRRR